MKVTCDISVTSAPHRPVGDSAPWYTPWNSPTTDTVPGMVMDFSNSTYGLDGVLGNFASTVSFSRAGNATRTDATGAHQIVGSDVARIEHDATTLAQLGLLLETDRTNLVIQSDAPSDQTISVLAVPHAISFYGTGTVTLSGAHVASVSGSGVYPTRTTLSFTPTAGNLIMALTGDITKLQLEEGGETSSYIQSGAAATSRAEEEATVVLGPWFNTNAGTLVFEGSLEGALANDRILELDAGSSTTRMSVLWNTVLGKPQFQVWQAGVLQAAIAPAGNSINLGDPFRLVIAYAANDFCVSLNGGAVAADNSGLLATGPTTLRLGRSVSGAQGLMLTENVVYYPSRLSDIEIQALSA